MARPRKRTSTSTGKISKLERQQRSEQEKELKGSRSGLVAPDWLEEEAAEEFDRVVKEAGYIDILDNLDLTVLAIYANAWYQYVEVSKRLNKEGVTVQRENTYETYEAPHPLVRVQNGLVKDIMSCSTKLGLATTDRLKLIVPTKEESETNKYLKYV